MTKFKIKSLLDSRLTTKDKHYLAVDDGNEFMFHGDHGKAVRMPWTAILGEDPLFSVVEGLEELRSGGYFHDMMNGYVIVGTTEIGDVDHKEAKRILMTRDNLRYLHANLTEREALTKIQDQLHEEGYTCVYITEIKELTYMIPDHERDEDNKLIASSAQKLTLRMGPDVSFSQEKYFFDEEEPVDVIHDENYMVSFKHRGEDAPDFVFKTQKQREEDEKGLWAVMRHCRDQGSTLYFKRPRYGLPVSYDKLEGAKDPHKAYMTDHDDVIVKLVDGTEMVIGKAGKLDVGWKFLGSEADDNI
ncbi:hypothetical protein 010DV004_115 [Bacillus phage 010DV004]|nr:hypothetical protein 010DV004_115 [Bacillus phage 010DV004]QZA69332.1 hypothetical protein 010DV005_115 [Bacillus phage 010DV005]